MHKNIETLQRMNHGDDRGGIEVTRHQSPVTLHSSSLASHPLHAFSLSKFIIHKYLLCSNILPILMTEETKGGA